MKRVKYSVDNITNHKKFCREIGKEVIKDKMLSSLEEMQTFWKIIGASNRNIIPMLNANGTKKLMKDELLQEWKKYNHD